MTNEATGEKNPRRQENSGCIEQSDAENGSDTTDVDVDGESSWTVYQRGLDGTAAAGQTTLGGGIAKAASREGTQ